jgi:hypothetical protein
MFHRGATERTDLPRGWTFGLRIVLPTTACIMHFYFRGDMRQGPANVLSSKWQGTKEAAAMAGRGESKKRGRRAGERGRTSSIPAAIFKGRSGACLRPLPSCPRPGAGGRSDSRPSGAAHRAGRRAGGLPGAAPLNRRPQRGPGRQRPKAACSEHCAHKKPQASLRVLLRLLGAEGHDVTREQVLHCRHR